MKKYSITTKRYTLIIIIDRVLSKALVFFNKNTVDFAIKVLLLNDILEMKNFKKDNNLTFKRKSTVIGAIKRADFFLSLEIENIMLVRKSEYKEYEKLEYLRYYTRKEFQTKNELPIYRKKLANDVAKRNINFLLLEKNLRGKEISINTVDREICILLQNMLIGRALYNNKNFQDIRAFITNKLYKHFQNLTRHDTDVETSTLTQIELKQALNNSIAKFIELHYQQPKQLQIILKSIDTDIISEPLEVIRWQIENSDDVNTLKALFREYKRDMKGMIYNYSLFEFIYYYFSFKVSSQYIYNSSILKKCELYTYRQDRKNPDIKKTATNKLSVIREINKEISDDETIFLDNLISFLEDYIPKKYNYYSIAYLMQNLHNSLTDSKSFIESLECKSYKNIKKEMIPQPINTLLLPPFKIVK